MDVTLKASRSVSVSAVPTVPNEEDDVRHDHHTAVLSAFDAMGESEKEQEKKLLVAEWGEGETVGRGKREEEEEKKRGRRSSRYSSVIMEEGGKRREKRKVQ